MTPHVHSVRILVFLAFAGACRMAFGGGAQAWIRLQPVQPQTDPPSSYPLGTSIIGNEIILGSVPARVWFEVQVTGWPPDDLSFVQAHVSATDSYYGTAGYAGSNASCMGSSGLTAGNLQPALQPCETHADCRALSGPQCMELEASRCINWNGLNPSYVPAGKYCEAGFQNRCHPSWIAQELDYSVTAVDLSTVDFLYGFRASHGDFPSDFQPTYFGTLVLDVPIDAKGTYLIELKQFTTWLWPNPITCPPGSCDPFWYIGHAIVTVPCGRCCYDLGGESDQCVDHVSANECAAYGVGAVFQANEVCPEAGGPACPECGLDDHCDDGLFCNGAEICVANTCGPGTPPCEPYEECEEDRDDCSPRIPAVSAWGLAVLGLTLLIAAKIRGRSARANLI